MRLFTAATLFTLSTLAIAGCAVAPEGDDLDGDEDPELAAEATRISSQLVGAWETSNGNARNVRFVFRDDNTYFADRRSTCAPPPNSDSVRDIPCIVRETGTYIAVRTSRNSTLTLRPAGGSARRLPIRILTRGNIQFGDAAYVRLPSYCSAAVDCEGQSFNRPACLGRATCEANRCGYSCGGAGPFVGPH